VQLPIQEQEPLDALNLHCERFLLDREAGRCAPKTLAHYRYTVSGFVARLREQDVKCPTDITPCHIRAHLVGLQRRGLKDTTQHAHARAIKTWLNWLSQGEVLEVSPMRKVSMPKLDRRIQPRFTSEEVKALLALCDSSPRGLRHRAIILGLLDSGLRASEFVSLKLDDVDMRTGLVTVVGKGNKQRQVRFGVKTRKSILKNTSQVGNRGQKRSGWLRESL
jgi:integrase/recombinase XerC